MTEPRLTLAQTSSASTDRGGPAVRQAACYGFGGGLLLLLLSFGGAGFLDGQGLEAGPTIGSGRVSAGMIRVVPAGAECWRRARASPPRDGSGSTKTTLSFWRAFRLRAGEGLAPGLGSAGTATMDLAIGFHPVDLEGLAPLTATGAVGSVVCVV